MIRWSLSTSFALLCRSWHLPFTTFSITYIRFPLRDYFFSVLFLLLMHFVRAQSGSCPPIRCCVPIEPEFLEKILNGPGAFSWRVLFYRRGKGFVFVAKCFPITILIPNNIISANRRLFFYIYIFYIKFLIRVLECGVFVSVSISVKVNTICKTAENKIQVQRANDG